MRAIRGEDEIGRVENVGDGDKKKKPSEGASETYEGHTL